MNNVCHSVGFLGEIIDCECFEHAQALHTARQILVGADVRPYLAAQLVQLAGVLSHYRCYAAAHAMAERASLAAQGS
jgi:hypothetical protein